MHLPVSPSGSDGSDAAPRPGALTALGWSAARAAELAALGDPLLEPARVGRVDRGRLSVLSAIGDEHLRHRSDRWPELTVGDWVAIRRDLPHAPLRAVLQRSGAFIRHAAGTATAAQALCANVDVGCIVVALDGRISADRIDRYLALVWSSGAEPLILVSKADLDDAGAAARAAELAERVPGVAVLAVSALGDRGLEPLQRRLAAGATAVLIGASGAGKSTLANRLSGSELLRVEAVRDADGRGRHTTTHRELVAVPGGGCVIDTPGLRELFLWHADEGVGRAFGDLAELAQECRFNDCGHTLEPGCAIQAAIAAGSLDAGRLESWRRLEREQRWLELRDDPRARSDQRRQQRILNRERRRESRSDRG